MRLARSVARRAKRTDAPHCAVLTVVGGDYRNIIKFSTFFVHSQDIEAFMGLRQEAFPRLFGGDNFPPNTILVVDRLVKEDSIFEVEAVAQIV